MRVMEYMYKKVEVGIISGEGGTSKREARWIEADSMRIRQMKTKYNDDYV